MVNRDISSVTDSSDKVLSLQELVSRVHSTGRADWSDMTKGPGIYIAFLPPGVPPEFKRDAANAIHACAIPVSDLQEKWRNIVSSTMTDILYVGKGDDIRKRVRTLARFGAGKAKNHKGGEWIWQVSNVEAIGLRVIACPSGRQVPFEKWVLDSFRSQHGNWPLANRKGGDGLEQWHP